jgi:hypothetical protein
MSFISFADLFPSFSEEITSVQELVQIVDNRFLFYVFSLNSCPWIIVYSGLGQEEKPENGRKVVERKGTDKIK